MGQPEERQIFEEPAAPILMPVKHRDNSSQETTSIKAGVIPVSVKAQQEMTEKKVEKFIS